MAALLAAGPAHADVGAAIAAFAPARPGAELPAPWRARFLSGVKAAEVRLVSDEGATVLRIDATAAAGSAAHPLAADASATPRFTWRWKVSAALDNAAWGTRAGDDFAARVYVAFDLPLERLSFFERTKLRLARFLYGDDVPSAAICYAWASGVAPGTSGWNPYAERVRMIAVRSGNEAAGRWVEESRDIEADFRAAFGPGPVPRVSGIAASSDTDQTLGSATAWFADFRLEGARAAGRPP